MEWLCPVIGVLAVVVFVVTLVGHGLWVLFSRVFGGSSARREWEKDVARTALPGTRESLAAARREIERLRRVGQLDLETSQKVLAAIDAEELGPLTVPVRPAPPLVPSTPPPIAASTRPPVESPEPVAAPTRFPEPTHSPDFRVPPAAVPPVRPAAPAPPVVPAAPIGEPRPVPEPRKALSAVLTAFMEEKNIRWGELIGGMLIVLCSTALVVSLWSQIAAVPFVKFFVFTAVTAALFGVGLYTEHRWKLPTTSRGILITATLLVPLTFLAISAFSKDAGSRDWLAFPAELLALVVFAGLLFWSAKVIAPQWPLCIVISVLGSSAAQLLIRRFVSGESEPGTLLWLGAVPLAFYGGAIAWMLWVTRTWPEIDRPRSNAVFLLVGVVSFAAVTTFGLLLFKSAHTVETLRRLSMLVALFGLAPVVTGLLFWQKVKAADLAGVRTAGTGIGVAGVIIMMLGIGLAWPQPSRLLPIAALDCVILAGVALMFEIPGAHIPAGLCLMLAYLLGVQIAYEELAWQASDPKQVLHALLSARSGSSLVVLAALFIASWRVLIRLGRARHGVMLAINAAIAAGLSIVLVSAYGFGRVDDHGTTWVYAIYAVGALAAAGFTGRTTVTWAGSVLLLLAFVQGIVYRYGPAHGITDAREGWQMALLAHASVAALILIAANRVQPRRRVDFRALFAERFWKSSLATSSLAILPLVLGLSIAVCGSASLRTLWLAAVWLALAWESQSLRLFSAFQAAVAGSLVLGIVSHLSDRTWFVESAHPLRDPRTLQAVGIGLTLLSLVWVGVRLGVRSAAGRAPATAGPHLAQAGRLLNPPWMSVDRATLLAMLLGMVGLSLYGLIPGLAEEFARTTAAAQRALAGGWSLAPHALGPGAWWLLIVLMIAFAAGLWERFERDSVLALVFLCGWTCVLLAGRHEGFGATASALRWYLGVFWILASTAVWLRRPLQRSAAALRWPEFDARSRGLSDAVRVLLILTAVVPILAMTTLRVGLALAGEPPVGPAAGSVFARMGDMLSYAVPLALVSAGLIGHALREQSPRYALAAGLVVNYTVTLAWLMSAITAGRHIGRVELVELVQLNTITAALYALAWLAERRWIARITLPAGSASSLLSVQVGIGLAGNILLLIPAAAWLITRPEHPGPAVAAVGDLLGWAALICGVGAAVWHALSSGKPIRLDMLSAFLLAIGSLIAFDVCRVDAGQWRGYHTLLVASAAVAWLVFALAHPQLRAWFDRSGVASRLEVGAEAWTGCLQFLGVITLLLAMRGVLSDPGRPWWSVGAIIALSVLAAAMAWSTRTEHYLYACALLFNLATSVWWLTRWWEAAPGRLAAPIIELIEVNTIALLAPGLCSLLMTLRGIVWQRKVVGAGVQALHAGAATVGVVALLGAIAVGIAADAQARPIHPSVVVGWLAWSAMTVLTLACLWDLSLGAVGQLVYLAGLGAVGMAMDQADLEPRWLLWGGVIALAIWSLLTNLLFLVRRPCLALAVRWRLPDRTLVGGGTPAAESWLVPASLSITAVAVVLGFSAIFDFDAKSLNRTESAAMAFRLIAALAVLVQTVGVGLLAHALQRVSLQQCALLLGAVAAIAIGWACVEPGGPNDSVLSRAVVLMVAVAVTTTLYGVVLSKLRRRETSWTQAGDRAMPWLVGAGIAALCVILGGEVFYQATRGFVPMGYPSILAVLLALIALVPVTLTFAIVPGRDPLGLSEAQRTLYVYTAEILLALMFMHIRLTMPWLFKGFFERYWPLIVMLIAFLGVGLSELFRRQNRRVLAEPLERTGALLPMLPVLAFWSAAGRSEVHYSLQLVVVGSLYAVLSVRRRSFAYGVLAALAGNGGLWYFLSRLEGYGLLQHPQLWFIPVAVSMLLAAYLNRERLEPAQMATIRYLSMGLIYLSSTMEIFLNGVKEAPWLPLVLAGLSVAGVLLGIVLRVRSFLFLGSLFLLVSLLTMIWHASANLGWTWLWYVAGIALGLAIITVFALFEKKRTRILQLIDGLKGWHA